jgi:hypothetical protein
VLESMPVLPRDTSRSEPYMRLSPHTAPSSYLLSQGFIPAFRALLHMNV